MKKYKTLIVLVIALVAGSLSVVLASQWLTNQSNGDVVQVAVAMRDIGPGQRLNREMIKMVEWPSKSIPVGVTHEITKLEGRVLKNSILKDEPIYWSRLAPAGTAGGLSAVIAEGYRAITVRVNDVVGVGGFALPGNYVDIIVSTQNDEEKIGSKEKNISKIILERILVLAIAQEIGRDDTKPKVVNAVTLEVTPEQAEKLDVARSVGNLSLVLRNQVDFGPGVTKGETKESILGNGISKPIQAVQVSYPIKKENNKKNIMNEKNLEIEKNCVNVISGFHESSECF
jgi:pilus assembly protein CpaB